MTPVRTKGIEGGILSRFATIATTATTASSNTSTWIVEVIGAQSQVELIKPVKASL